MLRLFQLSVSQPLFLVPEFPFQFSHLLADRLPATSERQCVFSQGPPHAMAELTVIAADLHSVWSLSCTI